MSTGVGPGKSFVMQQSRCDGRVGGCVWVVVCVLMMSAWDDGDAGTFDLASDFVATGGVASGLTWSDVDDSAAEEIGGPTRKGDDDLASDLDAAGGVAGGLTRKGDDAEETGGLTRKGDDDLASDLVAAGGVAGGLTRKGDDAEEIGGAVFGFGAAEHWSHMECC